MKKQDIDIVIMWVDGSDQKWIKKRNQYRQVEEFVSSKAQTEKQYRNWDNLHYVLRSIETNMPWVRKVHLVTDGQKPAWLNMSAKKLHWVKHTDFMPREYLPTFSSHAIELNMHRIKGLANKFIFMNDDMFITNRTKPTDFFSRKGLPKDQCVMLRITSPDYREPYSHYLLNDIGIINKNFKRNHTIKKNLIKFFSIKNGLLAPLVNLSYLPTNHFPGFMINHMPQAYLKSTLAKVWETEESIMDKTSRNKFRAITDVNQYLFREWQLVTGHFAPTNLNRHSKYFSIFPDELQATIKAIRHGRQRMLCINDVEAGNFEATKSAINNALDGKFNKKSEFEI